MDSRRFTPRDLTDLAARLTGRDWRKRPVRFLLDSRLFHLLCRPGTVLDGFKESLARHRLAPKGRLPDLRMTPFAILDAIGMEPPLYRCFPISNESARGGAYDIATVLLKMIKERFGTAPTLQAASLLRCVDELRRRTDPAARELFDLCLTRAVAHEGFEEALLNHVAFDSLFQFRFPEELREETARLFSAFIIDDRETVSGASKVRLLKAIWDRSYVRLFKANPQAREEIQEVDREMRLKGFKDFLGWETLHHSILGYAEQRVHPVVAFTLDPEVTLEARCKAHKTALRVFFDQLLREGNPASFRPRFKALIPGLLVPCREDGTFDAAVSPGELPIFY